MTDNEIIKTLEKSADYDCNECTWQGEICEGEGCEHVMSAQILNLITRQRAEIARLDAQKDAIAKQFYKEGIRDLAEKLKEAPVDMELPLTGLQSRAEAELCFCRVMLQIRDLIDNLVKEMAGEDDAQT